MTDILKMYINGEWRLSSSGAVRELVNPYDSSVFGLATEGDVDDVKSAIYAARKALEHSSWANSPLERANILNFIADKIEDRMKEFQRAETINTGKVLSESMNDVVEAINCFRYFAKKTEADQELCEIGQTDFVKTFIIREPVGVCGIIVPWNYPLATAAWKIAPALAAGNTIVFKPASITPLTAYMLFEILHEAGLPAGVVNLILGEGKTVGNEIANSLDVDLISFTGSTETGRIIMQGASNNIKKVSLELGGKSPNIVFADADMDKALKYAIDGIFYNQGQICSAGSRLMIEDCIYDEFVNRLVEETKKIIIGNGLNSHSQMGPLISKAHMEKVQKYIQIGKDEGARLLTGGNRILKDELKNGFFLEPTIFDGVTPDMRIVKEEIFGPVLVIQKFKDEEEAIIIANDTDFGLAGGVFTSDYEKAMRVCQRIRAGVMWINTYNVSPIYAPWGGYKQSGLGRELGIWGYEEFTEIKQINIGK